jgi:hypothetical protein
VDEKKTRMTLIASFILALYGTVMSVLMVTYYVRPFQAARGELMPDGSINWFTGEAILAASWFFLYVGLGWFSARIIRRGYSPTGRDVAGAGAT